MRHFRRQEGRVAARNDFHSLCRRPTKALWPVVVLAASTATVDTVNKIFGVTALIADAIYFCLVTSGRWQTPGEWNDAACDVRIILGLCRWIGVDLWIGVALIAVIRNWLFVALVVFSRRRCCRPLIVLRKEMSLGSQCERNTYIVFGTQRRREQLMILFLVLLCASEEPPTGRVKVVLDSIISSSREQLCNFRPLISVSNLSLNENRFLSWSPRTLWNSRIYLIVPAFAALFASTIWKARSYSSPAVFALRVLGWMFWETQLRNQKLLTFWFRKLLPIIF